MAKKTGLGVLIMSAFFFLTHASGQGVEGFPKGTFSTKIETSDLSLRFDGKGNFTVLLKDEEVVYGTYKVSKDQIEFTDVKGKFASKDLAKTGTYKWKLDDKKLTFKTVEDKNPGREKALTSGPWVKK